MSARIIIVTGGFGVLGKAVAAAFTANGDQVARVDYAMNPPDAMAALDIGGVDISEVAVAQQTFSKVVEILGVPSILVNIAGGFVLETLDDGDPSTWQKMFKMNLLTTVTMTKVALPSLKCAKMASIINIGAVAAIKASGGMGSYAASKSGVHRLTESLAEELKKTSVTVNAILPTIIDTPTNRADMPKADYSEWVKPETIAEVVLFLASTASRAITGSLIAVSRAA